MVVSEIGEQWSPQTLPASTLAIDEYDKLATLVNDFSEEIEGLGMNPFKGF